MRTIERTIIAAMIRELRAVGFQPAAFYDGEAYQMPGTDGTMASFDVEPRTFSSEPCVSKAPDNIARPMTDAEAFDAIDSVDEGTLHFTNQRATTWGARGVLLILGNGEDVISDYHIAESEPQFAEAIERVCDRLNDGKLL